MHASLIAKINTPKRFLLIALAIAIGLAPLYIIQLSSAASLTEVVVRFDRMKTSQATTGTVCAKPATAATEDQVKVDFPTGYTLGAAATFTVNTTNTAWPIGGTAWPSIATATN